jgi:hypothetical protein
MNITPVAPHCRPLAFQGELERPQSGRQTVTGRVCAGHVVLLGGESPLSSQGKAKDKGSARASPGGGV